MTNTELAQRILEVDVSKVGTALGISQMFWSDLQSDLARLANRAQKAKNGLEITYDLLDGSTVLMVTDYLGIECEPRRADVGMKTRLALTFKFDVSK